MNKPIGVFDSGVGGLTVLNSIRKDLKHENIIYIGDNIHCPYGEKTKEQLLEYTTKICDYFISQDVKMIVLACNTTSANVLIELQTLYPQIQIVGVINSTVHDFLNLNKKNVLVIATHATIHSHQYKDTIHSYDSSINVYELETPLLVPLIESGQYKKGIEDVLTDYLKSYKNKIDSLVLGCTHYPIVLDQFKKVMGDIAYISSSHAIVNEVSSYLKVHHLSNKSSKQGKISVYTTGNIDEFINSSEGFFDYQDIEVQYLNL